MSRLDELTTGALLEGFPMRHAMPALASAESGFSTPRELLADLARRTICMTMLAGSGSRWVSSIMEAKAAGHTTADPAAPRGLYGVANRMGIGPESIPIAAYALGAVRDLGRHVIVVRGWEREIEDSILRPLSYPLGTWTFATQDAPGGKPRGHGDAAWQTRALWSRAEYVIVNFGGDASSPLTAFSSLAVLDALVSYLGDQAPGLLMPAAYVESPAYPIDIDEQGLPRHFGHAKLQGGSPLVSHGSSSGHGYTNVGVRVYRSKALLEAIEAIRDDHWSLQGGYDIPGNVSAGDDPHGGEFALDNVDAKMAEAGQARLLAVARPEELSPVKSLADLARFEDDIALVSEDWAVLRGLLE